MSKTIAQVLAKLLLDSGPVDDNRAVPAIGAALADIEQIIGEVIGESEGILLWPVSLEPKKTLVNRDRKNRDKLRLEQRSRLKKALGQ